MSDIIISTMRYTDGIRKNHLHFFGIFYRTGSGQVFRIKSIVSDDGAAALLKDLSTC